MMRTSHRLCALATGAAVLIYINADMSVLTGGIYLGGVIIGSLLPDADKENATISKYLLPILLPVYILRMLLRLLVAIFPLVKKINKILAHRALSHTPFFWTIVTAALYGYSYFMVPFPKIVQLVVYGILTGVTSHIFCDLITGGVPILFPFTLKRIKIPFFNFKTGGLVENILVAVAAVFLLFSIYRIYDYGFFFLI